MRGKVAAPPTLLSENEMSQLSTITVKKSSLKKVRKGMARMLTQLSKQQQDSSDRHF